MRDGGVDGSIFRRAIEPGEALMATGNRVDGLIDREVHDGHRTAGTPRSELLAEVPTLPFGDRRVIQA